MYPQVDKSIELPIKNGSPKTLNKELLIVFSAEIEIPISSNVIYLNSASTIF